LSFSTVEATARTSNRFFFSLNGCFVGPCFNAACSGAWAVPVCNAYCDHGSHFYATYYNVTNTVHIRRSINVANHRANWLRRHGDWHDMLAQTASCISPRPVLRPPRRTM
jgi:hypothetical protein